MYRKRYPLRRNIPQLNFTALEDQKIFVRSRIVSKDVVLRELTRPQPHLPSLSNALENLPLTVKLLKIFVNFALLCSKICQLTLVFATLQYDGIAWNKFADQRNIENELKRICTILQGSGLQNSSLSPLVKILALHP